MAGRKRQIWLMLAMLLAATWFVLPNSFRVLAAVDLRPAIVRAMPPHAPALAEAMLRPGERAKPGLSNEAYIRPEFRRQMRELRPVIVAAAKRHNRPGMSGMTDQEFAVVVATLLYNENVGWFEEEVQPIRGLTPFYQSLQVQADKAGANLSVWPANLRPSVAAEILRQRIPIPAPINAITRTITVEGSSITPGTFTSQGELYAAITREIATPDLAVEYLAANIERGLYRASFEDVPVTWRTLAAWHNQGIVAPYEIVGNPTSASYVNRASAYLPAAHALIEQPVCALAQCTVAEQLQRDTEWLRWR